MSCLAHFLHQALVFLHQIRPPTEVMETAGLSCSAGTPCLRGSGAMVRPPFGYAFYDVKGKGKQCISGGRAMAPKRPLEI